MKVAINKCYGGFSPSDALFGVLIGKGWEVTTFGDDGNYVNPDARISDTGKKDSLFSRYAFVEDRADIKLRTDPELIEAIEKLGAAASGPCGKLKVVEIPDDTEFTIEDYDGWEHIAEVHRTWG
ncbi:hypothetical protein [Paenibacillus apiarius]|uniref:hypothetical protein n=1 Tax=Paenibacillus apiarius TaxID=46240 RepID=UPI003B3A5829